MDAGGTISNGGVATLHDMGPRPLHPTECHYENKGVTYQIRPIHDAHAHHRIRHDLKKIGNENLGQGIGTVFGARPPEWHPDTRSLLKSKLMIEPRHSGL